MSVYRDEGGNRGGGRSRDQVGVGLVGKGQLIFSMGLIWKEVRILAHRASTQVRDFSYFNHDAHCR